MKLLVAGVASAARLVPAAASARPADVVPPRAGALVLIAAGGFGAAYRVRTRLADGR